jgi:hypothetical protein
LYTAPAAACSRIYPEPFRIDPSLAAEDSEAPAPFQAVSALTYRIEAERCVNGVCTTSSCGDDGVLELRFAPPAEAAAGELGYKLVWLGGDLPDALRDRLEVVLPLSAADEGVVIELGWNGITELDGELALVAVDHAGNESMQSESVHVAWSGCTEYYDESFCREGGSVLSTPAGCSVVSRPSPQTESPLGAAALFGLVTGCALRARRRGARTG